MDQNNGGATALKEVNNSKAIALMEAKMKKLCDLLSKGLNVDFLYFEPPQTIVRTKENVVKKQALTYDEMEAERETQADTESDDEEQQICNPLKLQWVGMESLFLTGCINFMVLVRDYIICSVAHKIANSFAAA
ncbi:hypothetical protein GH714_028189 [Hevea brasiliensis]|uniref:Uncharacterized protein n=1 Tax=Hevea brasiliensis TaxID=3981 RepID=A0A6A6MED1_HEVBR|nr:hypothetical protein GH714_028189 [Hevea brasiliensis]